VDVLVHECTNACTNFDRQRGRGPDTIRRLAVEHGHSTPQMAAQFASEIGER